jgi:hypothetical protein
MPLLEINHTRHISASVRLDESTAAHRSTSTPLSSTHPQTMLWTKHSTVSSRRAETFRTFLRRLRPSRLFLNCVSVRD